MCQVSSARETKKTQMLIIYRTCPMYDKHVLSHILPDPNNHTFNLRPRRHELTLAIKGDARNFFERQLFKDIY